MLFDTHTHVSSEAFEADREAVLARARAAGLGALVDVGISLASSRGAVALAAREPDVYAAVGIHPYDAAEVDDAAIAELRGLCEASDRVVAIGETGFDFFNGKAPRDVQVRATRLHLDLCRERALPVVLHLRSSRNAGAGAEDAYDACLELLERYRGEVTGIAHCFSATPAYVERFCDLGFYISFAGNVTYKSAKVLRASALAVPEDRLLVETDCPYLSPQGNRGERNEPSYVVTTATRIAEVRGLPAEALFAQTARNACRLFFGDENHLDPRD